MQNKDTKDKTSYSIAHNLCYFLNYCQCRYVRIVFVCACASSVNSGLGSFIPYILIAIVLWINLVSVALFYINYGMMQIDLGISFL
jgi:hypothetical protein